MQQPPACRGNHPPAHSRPTSAAPRAAAGVQVPACYLHTPPRLQAAYFAKFQPDTLFYIFYGMPGDEAQMYAADELAARCVCLTACVVCI